MVLPFTVSKRGDGTGADRLMITGEIDQDVSECLTMVIVNAVEQNGVTAVTVDLHRGTFLSAAGVRALLQGRAAASARGCAYRVVNAHGLVHEVLRISGVAAALGITRVRDHAEPAAPADRR